MPKTTNTMQTLAANLALLITTAPDQKKPLEWLARRSGVSKRMIQYLLKCERTATIDVAQKLAEPFGLSGWQLIMPNLRADMVKNGHLADLIYNYQSASEEGREYIYRVSEHEARYGTSDK